MSKSEAIISVIVIAFVAVMGVRVWIGYRTEQRDHAHEPSADTDMSWQQDEDAMAGPTTRTPTEDVIKTNLDIALRDTSDIVPDPEPDPIPPVYAISEQVPLSPELQKVLKEACELYDVPVELMLGLIEVESNFQTDADSGTSYGLCQINRNYAPDDMTPTENIQFGTDLLSRLLDRYHDNVGSALRAYNRGFDDGERGYSSAVITACHRWEDVLNE